MEFKVEGSNFEASMIARMTCMSEEEMVDLIGRAANWVAVEPEEKWENTTCSKEIIRAKLEIMAYDFRLVTKVLIPLARVYLSDSNQLVPMVDLVSAILGRNDVSKAAKLTKVTNVVFAYQRLAHSVVSFANGIWLEMSADRVPA